MFELVKSCCCIIHIFFKFTIGFLIFGGVFLSINKVHVYTSKNNIKLPNIFTTYSQNKCKYKPT